MGIESSLPPQATLVVGRWQQQASFYHLDFQGICGKESQTPLSLLIASGFEGLYHGGRVYLLKVTQNPEPKGILNMTDYVHSTSEV